MNADFWKDKINATDPDDRYYPLPVWDVVEPSKTDVTLQTLDSGQEIVLQDGIQSFSGVKYSLDANYIEKVKRCGEYGFFTIDECGRPWGDYNKIDNKLYPKSVFAKSARQAVEPKTSSTEQGVRFTWQYKRTVLDQNIRGIDEAYIDEDLLELRGLLDIQAHASSPTATDVVLRIHECYGSVNENADGEFSGMNPIKGLGPTDFILLDGITPIVVTAATEGPDGEYLLEYAAQTPPVTVTAQVVAVGYYMTPLNYDIV
jgi:hypothetical protein